ncbi:MAG TPA: D-glycero-beta-D-manno-heptose 1-phosphate adenylyltransferase [Caulobacteraceae bacterium]|jgi:D-beta-D-heptose 7-phosphate kinase/D-beta-D-heptose 1-phosphate adenosyltransferase
MDLSTLQPLLAAMSGVPVACVGDVMLDRYVYGEVARISPEAPIPVLRKTSETAMLGAAGNVARNVVAMGGTARLSGRIGTDAAGGEVLQLVGVEPGVEPFLIHAPGVPTTVKTRFVAAGQQLLRLDEETHLASAPAATDGVLESVTGARAVLVSDYGKGLIDAGLMERLTSAAGAPVIVDPKGRDFVKYGRVALIKPNASELSALTGLPVGSDGDAEAALAAALALCAAEAILVTRAAHGMSLARRGEPVRHFRARPREVFDVSGAGDTSLAALGLALGAGASLEEAVELAVLASGVAVEKVGTAVVTPAELLDAELAAHRAPADAKVATPDRAVDDVARWRARGLRVGFTNGCFDVLHRGHVAYLAQARSWCDRLVLGLNTDASVRRLKGPERPVNDLESRALVLGGLSSVDLVVPFDDDTPIRLIEALRPDVLIKGADYTVEGVVGGDLVKGWGGEVRLADIVEGQSTTSAIKRMRRGAG